ncbi:hypothetical protein [Vibrio variabilis]|uniref:hypothetical protein n=1 Tax=Vibrio variabilis TaxID=990271 RepID=UPI000DDBEBAF|nr:hypothetical protein [Vibrio variabilis]
MSDKNPLRQNDYQESICLNNRPYCLLDIGDGPCTIVLVTSIDEHKTNAKPDTGRKILFDISESWGHDPEKLRAGDIELLSNDIHLLLDVFWLNKVEFDTTVAGLDLSSITKRLTACRCSAS